MRSAATLTGALVLICSGAGLTVALVFMAQTDGRIYNRICAGNSLGSAASDYDLVTDVALFRTLISVLPIVGTVMTVAGFFIAYKWFRARLLLSEVIYRIGLGIWALGCLLLAIPL